MKSKIALATLMALVSLGANAADSTGQVTFNGEVVDSPCLVAPGADGLDVKVDFGQVSMKKMNAGETVEKPFTIKLIDCDLEGKTADLTFNGTNLTAANSLIEAGVGMGVGVKGYTFGTAVAAPEVVDGAEIVLNLIAEAKQADAATAVTAGKFSAISDFIISYK